MRGRLSGEEASFISFIFSEWGKDRPSRMKLLAFRVMVTKRDIPVLYSKAEVMYVSVALE